jgi:SAM-dependent methyltransferase
MTQNIYDNVEFFQGYGQLRRSVDGLDGAPEWPALRALLPELRGRKVLDLGCGYGWFSRWAKENGAARVLGIDVSEKMLARARSFSDDPAVSYLQADLELVVLPKGVFDLIYSSLTLHYIEALKRLLTEVHGALVSGGRFVFSVEHPIYSSAADEGWSVGARGRRIWSIEGYLNEGVRSRDWLTKGVVKQHRTIGAYVNLLLGVGFELSYLEEWGPSEQQIAKWPALAEDRERPAWLLISARARTVQEKTSVGSVANGGPAQEPR